MEFVRTEIKDVVILKPQVHGDERGYFIETFRENEFFEKLIKIHFIQDNESKSSFGVLRGLHYQIPPFSQSKLVRVIKGNVLDVAVDIRKGSPTFGKYVAIELSGDNKLLLFIPRGFAHGFVVLSEDAIFSYKCDNYYSKEHEASIIFNDKKLNIDWLLKEHEITLSPKDILNPKLNESILFDFKENLY